MPIPSNDSSLSRRGLLSAAGATTVALAASKLTAGAPANDAKSATQPTLPMTILLNAGLPDDEKKRISDISPDITLITDAKDIAKADAVFGMPPTDELKRAEKLKWVQYPAAGVEGILSPEFVARDVILTNAKGCYGPQIAEHAFGLLLSLTRGIALQTQRMVSDGQWGYDGPQQVDINGMTMGIIGIGGIGREIARRAKAMGMTVLAVDNEPYTFQHLGGVVDELAMVDDGLDVM